MTYKVIDILNIFLVNVVCDICIAHNLVNVVSNSIGSVIEIFLLVYVVVDNVHVVDCISNEGRTILL